MKVKVRKDVLVDTISKAHQIARKAIRPDFMMEDKLTFVATDSSLSVNTGNGYLEGTFKFPTSGDESAEVEKSGTVTVDATVFKGIVESIGGSDSDDHEIQLETRNGTMSLRDLSVPRKKVATLKSIDRHHQISIKKPAESNSFSFSFEGSVFSKIVDTLSKYSLELAHKRRYQMLCMHFKEDESRFVCGDGMRFGVLTMKGMGNEDAGVQGKKFLLPARQLATISKIAGAADEVTFTFGSDNNCYVAPKNGNCKLMVRGIPAEEYIDYERHSSRYDEAQLVADVEVSQLREIVGLTGSVRDKDAESKGRNYHSFEVSFGGDKMEAKVAEGKYQCDIECPAEIHDFGSTVFRDEYAWMFINEISDAYDAKFARFYAIAPGQPIVVRMVDTTEAKDDKGLPAVKDSPDQSELLFFFAAAKKTGSSNAEKVQEATASAV